ncbi:MAG: ribbon-helix-helix protein, CopG family [Terriglobales bacterium]
MKRRLTFRIPDSLYKELRRRAAAERRNVPNLLRVLIETHTARAADSATTGHRKGLSR